jgi:hypothetical protein
VRASFKDIPCLWGAGSKAEATKESFLDECFLRGSLTNCSLKMDPLVDKKAMRRCRIVHSALAVRIHACARGGSRQGWEL